MTAVQNVLTQANEALYTMGGHSTNRYAIAAQFVQEKGWKWWENPQAPYNVGNVTNGGVQNGFKEFPDILEGVKGYAHVLTTTSFNDGQTLVYQNVLDAIKIPNNNEGILEALHNSPFCEPPYPLEILQSVMQEVYDNEDAETHAVTPPEPQPEGEFVTVTATGWSSTLWGIAQDKFGNGALWTQLEKLNPGVVATRLKVGQQIRVK